MFWLLLLTTLVTTGSGKNENPDESAAPLTPAKSSLWHKISKPIMSWFTGSGNDQTGQNSSDNTTEIEFNDLYSNWTNIFENMQKEMLRVYNRRMDVKNNAKTAIGGEKAVKVPNLEDIFQFIYVDEHATFVGDTFENAAERVYSCKRAFEEKQPEKAGTKVPPVRTVAAIPAEKKKPPPLVDEKLKKER
uniref:Secreted protein n=1 Tax=Globodera pallida TaxID=36090 RepID=A0A183BQL8_GLOPA